MATELAKAYVQIIPSAQGISGKISQALSGEAAAAGKSAGNSIVSGIGGIVAKGIAALGIGKMIKDSLEAGGALQQSFGGLDTLYEEAAGAAKKYATEAAAAGISTNDYAEQAVSFGAALKAAYGGDTYKAMEAANTAILDMADNSAKMGTDITSIQNAYQGFAKQNYTMLDNLKLGYGGTKAEMERLLADAEKLSGVKYNIDNLGDVYDAIHVIQDDLHLTGVAADEAKTTFTGSFGAMKAAAQNLMANLTLGEDIRPSLEVLSQTVHTFLTGNLFPMIGNVLRSLPEVVSGALGEVISFTRILSHQAPEIVQGGIELVAQLIAGIIEATPYLAEAAWNLAASFAEGLINTDWAGVASDFLSGLNNSLDLAAGEVFGSNSGIMDALKGAIENDLPDLFDEGLNIISNIIDGILNASPQLATGAGEIINSLLDSLLTGAIKLISSGGEFILKIREGITNNLPNIASSAGEIVGNLLKTIWSHSPQLLETGLKLIVQLIAGLIKAIPQIPIAVARLIKSLVGTFKGFDWKSLGKSIVEGIANGLKGAAGIIADAAKSAAKSAFEAAKDFLGINSPAKKGIYMGKMLDLGLAEGIEDNIKPIQQAMKEIAQGTTLPLQANIYGSMTAPSAGSSDNRSITIVVNAAEGQDEKTIAEKVIALIQGQTESEQAVYA